MIQWERESEYALSSVSACGELLLKEKNLGSIQRKESLRDIVTEYDLLIEKKIEESLKELNIPILGEESFSENPNFFETIKDEQEFWAVDPIDGTVNFTTGFPMYAVSIGLVRKQEFLTGAVSIPSLKELYFTHGDRGAFLNGKRLRLPGDFNLEDSLIVGGFSGKSNDEELRKKEFTFFGQVNDQSRGCLRIGSAAANVCNVAANRFQAAFGFCNKIWDVAGAFPVALQAGAKLNIRFRSPTKVDYVIGNPKVADELWGRMQEVLPDG